MGNKTIHFVFLPSWWNKNYGIKFGKSYTFDFEYRSNIHRKMQKYLYQRFGDIGLGDDNPEPGPLDDPEGLFFPPFANALIPALFGAQVKLPEDNFPWEVPMRLGDEDIRNLKVPDIYNSYPIAPLIRQWDEIRKRYGRETSSIWNLGVQNIAFKLRGEQLFIDYYENPELAHRLFEIIRETIAQLALLLMERHGETPLRLVIANCTVDFISPEIYSRFLYKHDHRLSEEFPSFGIHHCGVVDRMIDQYALHDNVSYIQVGWQSNLRKVCDTFPKASISYIFSAKRLMSASREDLVEDVRRIMDSIHQDTEFELSVPDIDYRTPDDNIRAVYEAFCDYSNSKCM